MKKYTYPKTISITWEKTNLKWVEDNPGNAVLWHIRVCQYCRIRPPSIKISTELSDFFSTCGACKKGNVPYKMATEKGSRDE